MFHLTKPCKIMSCKNHAKIVQNELLVSSVYRHTDYANSIFQRKPGRMRGRAKKTGPVKKEWQVGRDNDSRSRRPRTAAPGLAGADGAVVLTCGAARGLRAALARRRAATRAGQHCYSHLGCGRPARTSTTTSPSSARGPTTTSCCATGRRSSCAPCKAESTADQARHLPRQDEYLVHVPGRRSGSQGLAASKRAVRRTAPGAPHGGAAQRVRQ